MISIDGPGEKRAVHGRSSFVQMLLERPLPTGTDRLLSDFENRIKNSKVIYLSTPITTGERYIEWRRSHRGPLLDGRHESDLEVRAEVIAENVRNVRPLRNRLQERFPSSIVIDPTQLNQPDWAQRDYHRFWAEVIRRWADTIVFAQGWQYSVGCAFEYAVALELHLDALNSDLEELTRNEARKLLRKAIDSLEEVQISADAARAAYDLAGASVRSAVGATEETSDSGLKDDRLAGLARLHNVAAFVSFSPGPYPAVRHLVTGPVARYAMALDVKQAVARILRLSRTGSVNVRTFRPDYSKSSPFVYGIKSASEAAAKVREFAAGGYYTIVNETIDVNDGGVSGVTLGGVAEFAPDSTPRAVEEGDFASLPVEMANAVLNKVYGLDISLPSDRTARYEFSIHPNRVGHRRSHLCLWEIERIEPVALSASMAWPNKFSRLIGDKTFGLLLAETLGARVPLSTVVSRRLPPFRFGVSTHTGDWWLRTAPSAQEPGFFTTTSEWADPFALLEREDPEKRVSAVLAQEAVEPQYSGASLPVDQGDDLVEGVRGRGDDFMLGAANAVDIPQRVQSAVRELTADLSLTLGPVRVEWVFDGHQAWILQLHRVGSVLSAGVLSPGQATAWLNYHPSQGLEKLRTLVAKAISDNAGIIVEGAVGVTSHVGDILRKAHVPAKFAEKF